MGTEDRRDRLCIVAAGSSGLAVGKRLKEVGLKFDILEQSDEVGGDRNKMRKLIRRFKRQ